MMLSVMGGLALLAGCADKRVHPLTPPQPAVVWPRPPDVARIRYLGTLTGSEDVRARPSVAESLDAFLFGPKPPTLLVTPYAVDVRRGSDVVAIADTGARCVHIMDLAGRTYRQITQCGRPPESLETPVAVAWVADQLWIADARLGKIGIVDFPGETSRWIGTEALKRPAGLAYCDSNELCYVTDAANHVVMAFGQDGTYAFQFGSQGAGPGQFNYPSHVACGPQGEIVVADSLNFRVQRFDADGAFLGAFGRKGDAAGDFALPKGVAVDANRNVWVVDAHFENVQALTAEGQLLMAFGNEGTQAGEFWLPAGICIDASGRIWVADGSNHRVQVFEILAS
jgi:DNA-binding beta-propeller fold protein YncE